MSTSQDKPVYVGREKYPEILNSTPIRTYDAADSEQGSYILDYWRVIVVRRWTVLAILATALAVALIFTLRQTPMYDATITLQIERETPSVLNIKDFYQTDDPYIDYTLQSYYKILSSRSLARRVIEELQVDLKKEFEGQKPDVVSQYLSQLKRMVVASPEPPAPDEPDALRPLIDEYVHRVTVKPIRSSWLVEVTFEAKDPKLATRVINAHGKHFIEQNIQNKFDATQQVSEFLSLQLVNLKANWENAEDKLQSYSRDNELVFTEDGKNAANEKLRQLQDEYTKAQAERFQKESYERLIQSGNSDALPQVTGNSMISSLSTKLVEVQREESELAVSFGADYPSRKRARSQIESYKKAIDAEKEKVVKTVAAEYSAAMERERLLAAALDEQRVTLNRISQEVIHYNILKREAESSKQIYEGLLTRLKEAGITGGLRASNIRVVDTAEIPKSPVKPRRTLNMSLGLIFGLVFGVGLALFQEYIDSSIKSPDDVTRHLRLATLGTVPKLSSLAARKNGYAHGYKYGYGRLAKNGGNEGKPEPGLAIELAPHSAPSSMIAESYRTIRTSLLLSFADRPPRSVLVTSALPSEGKTVTAVNTAIALTQTGKRVVLVDADMRKPRMHRIFHLKGHGLSSVLAGVIPLKDAISPTVIENLFVIPCGVIPPNPAELILSARFKDIMKALAAEFDYVIVDSPPLSNVSDGRILASSCDVGVLVVKAFSTSRHLANRALEHLAEAQVRVAGVVLNDLDLRLRSVYSAYYSKGYSYYHSYYGHIQEDAENTDKIVPRDQSAV